MKSRALAGTGVLLTRPESSNEELAATIRTAGGRVFSLPVFQIRGRDSDTVTAELAAMPAPDIALFVSCNAVRFGLTPVLETGAAIGAIGPATAEAIEKTGSTVSISPESGFDSEHLLQHPRLQDIAGRVVVIVRGNGGRELLAETLRSRGATVNYLHAYDRVPAAAEPQVLANLEREWLRGAVDCVVVMSVESLTGLLQLLPAGCEPLLRQSLLVTPSKRVIQTALERLPGANVALSDSPQAAGMAAAIIRHRGNTMEP